jgi:hypothetical protein
MRGREREESYLLFVICYLWRWEGAEFIATKRHEKSQKGGEERILTPDS